MMRLALLIAAVAVGGATACAKGDPSHGGAPGAEALEASAGAADGAAAALNPALSPGANDGPAKTGSGALPPGAVVVSRVEVADPGIIRRGPAFFGVLPAGWAAKGGVASKGPRCMQPVVLDWKATSPDGRSSISLFPTERWQWSTTGLVSDCPKSNIRTIREYLNARVAAYAPGARIIDFRERPDYAKSARELATMHVTAARQAGINDMHAWAEGGEVLYAFEENGFEMRGVQGAAAVFYVTSMANPMAGSQFDPLQGQPIESLTAGTVATFGATAPNGALDFKTIELVRKSFTPDPRWLKDYFGFKQKMDGIAADASRELGAIIVAGGAVATRNNIAAYEAMTRQTIQNSNDSIDRMTGSSEPYPGSNSQDRMQRESIEAVRGVETWRDSVDGTNVQLDANYDHAWRVNNQDTYILTTDPNFNPGQYGIEATQMGVVQ